MWLHKNLHFTRYKNDGTVMNTWEEIDDRLKVLCEDNWEPYSMQYRDISGTLGSTVFYALKKWVVEDEGTSDGYP